jgi:hypothetical protein
LLRAGHLIEQALLASKAGIEAAVAEGAIPGFMDAFGHTHQPHPIARVMLQGT